MWKLPLEELIDEFKLPVRICEDCGGEGEVTTFCGHDVQEYCRPCEGKGYKKKGD